MNNFEMCPTCKSMIYLGNCHCTDTKPSRQFFELMNSVLDKIGRDIHHMHRKFYGVKPLPHEQREFDAYCRSARDVQDIIWGEMEHDISFKGL